MAEKNNAKPAKKPDGPASPPRVRLSDVERGPRRRLCALLGLKQPSDAQLFEDAAELIEKLRAKK